MSKNPEFAKYASEIARSQDSIRSANEELIKLSQRFGRMVPRLQRLETPGIMSWLGLYNRVKDATCRVDEELSPLLNNEQVTSNPLLQSQVSYYCAQRARLQAKMEVMDDILNGMIEDLLENGSFEQSQKEEMKEALDGTIEKSKKGAEMAPILA